MRSSKKRGFKLCIPSFNLCRSKIQSDLPINPSPSFPCPSPVQPAPHRRASATRTVASAVCGCSRLYTTDTDDFAWGQDDTWHVVAKVKRDCDYDRNNNGESPPRRKIYTSAASGCDTDDDYASTQPIKARRWNKKKLAGAMLKLRVSSSSVDSCALSFSSDDSGGIGEETEQLIFSADETSSERHVASAKKQSIKRNNRGRQKTSPARVSVVLGRLMARRVEGKVRESLAVVKRSDDPYGDFKRSMLEMILEKEMFHEAELQQLLECFLSLNSNHHYPTILGAFSEVWDTLFCNN